MNPQRPVRMRIAISLVFLLALCALEAVAATPAPKVRRTVHSHAAAAAAAHVAAAPVAAAPVAVNPAESFFTLTPCRIFDSRSGAPLPLSDDPHNTITIPVADTATPPPGTLCGVPANATAVSLNVTVTQATTRGHILLFPSKLQNNLPPTASTVNFGMGETRANNGVEPLAADGTLMVLLYAATPGNTAHVIVDVTGYFADGSPMAKDDPSYTTTLNTDLDVPAPGVLANDTLNGATIVSYGATTGAEQTTLGTATPTSQGGSVTLDGNGHFHYTPANLFKGNDTFLYVIQNAVGSSTGTVTISVGKGNQTITYTSTAPAGAKVGGPTYTVTATASSGLPVTLSIDASATSVCTLSGSTSGSTVSFIGVGTCVIDADQAGDANWNAAPQAQQSFPVVKGDQTITFTSTPPASPKVGGTYVVTATASSGLPVTLSIDAAAAAVCSISGSTSGSTVTFHTVGTCVIDANQAGDTNWNAAPQAQQTVSVGKGDQTIAFTSTPPASPQVGGTYVVTATASSGLPVTLTIDASATSVCSISGSTSGSTVTFNATGNCVIDANQAGDTNWNAAPQAQQTVAVGKADQTITFTSTPPAPSKVGGTYIVTATASSSLPVTLSIDASATSVCSISGSTSGSTVTFNAVGTCVIDANQAGDANYNAAPQVQQSDPVSKGDQTITFTSTPPVPSKVGGTYIVTATASSGLPVTLSIDATATAICSISGSASGSTVTFNAVGTCVIDANQAGNANYNAAPQAQQSDPVSKGDQVITFTSTPPVPSKVGGTYIVTATASSGLPVTLSIDASAIAVCSISGSTSGSTVTFNAVGTCVIDANQAGNANYNAAPQAQQSDPVSKGDQTITFTSTPPVPSKVGGTYIVTATASSGLPVTLSIDASATSICSISGSTSGSTVTFNAVGTCVIDANQAGNANWNPAPQAQQSDPVAKGDQTITFTSTAPVNAKVGGPTYTVTATASSGLPVTLTIDAVSTSICTLSGSTSGSAVSFIGAGTCVIDANQAGNTNYNAAPQAQQPVPVAKGDQTITFTSTAPVNAKVGGPGYVVTASASSGLPVTLTIDAVSASICTLSGSTSGSTVSFIGAGTCVIDANQAGNVNYNAAPQVQQTFPVAKGDQTVTFTSTAPVNVHVGNTYVVTATASSGLPVVLSIDASATSICSISGSTSGSTVTFNAIGTCVIDANQPGNANWNPASQVQQTVQVINTPPMVIASPKESFQTIGNTAFDFRPSAVSHPGVFVSGKLLDNFQPDIDGPSPLSVTLGTATAGAIVTINSSDGAFTYIPPAGKTGSDTFTYVVSDGMDSVTRTVTINFVSRVWYVKNNATAGGLGRSNDPFDTLAEAQAASAANDYIFVYLGSGTNTGQNAGIVLKAGQHLLGEHVGLSIPITSGSFNGTPAPTNVNLVDPVVGNRPVIDGPASPAAGTGHGVEAVDIIPAEVRGFSIGAEPVTNGGRNAIEWRTTSAFAGSGPFTVSDNVVRGGLNGIHIALVGSGATSLALSDNSVTSSGNGIDIQETGTGALTITGFANNAISGNNVGTGILVNNAIFDAVSGGTLDLVSGGSTAIGASGNGVGGAGLVMSGVSGNLSFADLDIVAEGGAGLSVTGTGAFTGNAGFQIAVGNVSTAVATGGPAVSVSSATINLPFQLISSTNSTTTGVSLDTVGGTFSTTSGISSITGAAGTGFNINAGNAAVTYDGTIANTTGRQVSVTSTSGGTKSFTGAINGTGTGIFLNANTGATINFTGQLTLSTGANDAFTATGGGTVTATNTASTVVTTTGRAINVANTTIGSSGLKFKSVSAGTAASGPTSGIVLNATGASGALTVLGAGSAGSGGTIRKAGTGISLTSTQSPSFSWMQLNDFSDFAIRGTSVVNFTLANSVINGTNGDDPAADEGSIRFNELTGSASITSCSISGSVETNVRVVNTTGTLNRLTLTSTTIGTNSTTTGDDGLFVQAQSTAVMNVTVQNSFFTASRGDLAQFDQAGTGTMDVVLTGTAFSDNHPAIVAGGGGVVLGGTSGSMTYNVSGNTFRDATGTALAVSCGNAGVSCVGRLENNTIGVAGIANSGSTNASGIAVVNSGGGTVTSLINNNTIRQYNNHGILLQAGQTGGNATNFSATVTNNTIGNPGNINTDFNGIHLNNGTLPGENFTTCVDIRANSIAGAGQGTTPPNNQDFRLRQRQSTTVRLPGYAGANSDDAAVVAFVKANQTTVSTGASSNTVGSGGGGFIGGASCPTPP